MDLTQSQRTAEIQVYVLDDPGMNYQIVIDWEAVDPVPAVPLIVDNFNTNPAELLLTSRFLRDTVNGEGTFDPLAPATFTFQHRYDFNPQPNLRRTFRSLCISPRLRFPRRTPTARY